MTQRLLSNANVFSQGVKIKMDDAGNILVRRYSKSNVFVKTTTSSASDETAIGSEVLKTPNHCVEFDKVAKVSRCRCASQTQSLSNDYSLTDIRHEKVPSQP